MASRLPKIISGGQSGADRAALDWAIRNQVDHGGWCPKGRKSEDGLITSKYQLKETPVPEYSQRTEWNVRDSDGTVIFSLAGELIGGSKETAEFAQKLRKPWLHCHGNSPVNAGKQLKTFLQQNGIRSLNVAGSRASEEPAIYDFVIAALEAALL